MNEIINWIAIHNTLMIRIGFTAILVLLIVYIFRFFFVPKVNVVHESIEPKQTKETSEKNNSTESPSEDEAETAPSPAESNELKQYEKEIERLNKELALIRNQLKESDSPVAAVDVEKVNSLNQKIENLESRLAEYEIIAEDISEIGQLRKENAELKQKMPENSGNQNPQVAEETEAAASASEEPSTEPVAETKPLSEDLIAEEEPVETETPVENEVADIKLTSEKEVTQSERELIDQFEEISNKKGS